jgi:hypothetical protein
MSGRTEGGDAERQPTSDIAALDTAVQCARSTSNGPPPPHCACSISVQTSCIFLSRSASGAG